MDLLSFLASDLYEYLDRLSAFRLQSCWSSSSVQARGTSGGVPGLQHRSEREQGLQEGIQERRMGPRKERLELALECEVLDVLEVPGSASSRRM